jgi:transcriptional regulator with XRE-family HTH domain
MKKTSLKKRYTARNAAELANILGLTDQDAIELDFRAQLNAKIVAVVQSKRLTHVEVARRARASRTRITAILNGNTAGISTDLLLRILYSLGYKTRAIFAPVKLAA